MASTLISSPDAFRDLCRQIRRLGLVAFDTEFVSDRTYRPTLGLLQFGTREQTAAVDPLAVRDLTEWWKIMADGQTTVIVHGGQAEIRFCLQEQEDVPRKLFDVQIAEGFRSRSYPLSYSSIVRRVLNHSVDGSQTRTDWLRRPLSPEQIEYALEDVQHLIDVCDAQSDWLTRENRMIWAESECDRMVSDIEADTHTASWERLSGVQKLNRRELAVLQRLADWREHEAAQQNRPVRRILRDDLLVDLAKRRPRSIQQALATRDLNRREYRRHMEAIVSVIQDALPIPESQLPQRPRSRREEASSEEQVIAKLLALCLSNRCAELDIAYTLVATNRDLLELVRFHRLGQRQHGLPRLLQGWRDELFGDLLCRVMDGKVAFRVAPRGAPAPLMFE